MVNFHPTAGALNLLVDAVQRLASADTLQQVMEIVKTAARHGSSADAAAFVLREGDNCFYAEEDSLAPLWKGRRFPLRSSVSGWSMHHREVVVIPDVSQDDRVPCEAYQPTFVKSVTVVPVENPEQPAAIAVYWGVHHRPNEDVVNWLVALAEATSAALDTVRANQEARRVMTATARTPKPPEDERPLRMCAWSKRIFFHGEWMPVETFLLTRFGVHVTHGICEDAVRDLANEMDLHPRIPPGGDC